MKPPRINDFDPDTKIPPLASPLEGMPAIAGPMKPARPQQSIKRQTVSPSSETMEDTRSPERPLTPSSERANAPTLVDSFARTPVRPNGKRIITRNSFEIYEDQMDALRRLAFEDKMAGKGGSQSAMVREAIDAYLEKRKRK
jgi:hypothetical protein